LARAEGVLAPLVVIGGSLLAYGTLLLVPSSPLRAIVVILFLLVCPGWSIAQWVPLGHGIPRIAAILGVSLVIDMLVAQAMLYAGRWNPAQGFMLLFGFCLTIMTARVPDVLRTLRTPAMEGVPQAVPTGDLRDERVLASPVGVHSILTALRSLNVAPPGPVLVVDHSPLVRMQLRRSLRDVGWVVAEAEDPWSATEMVQMAQPSAMVIHCSDRSGDELDRLSHLLADPRVSGLPVLLLEEDRPELTRKLARVIESANVLNFRFAKYPATQGAA
jgi:CheY-like chemotaxis protein